MRITSLVGSLCLAVLWAAPAFAQQACGGPPPPACQLGVYEPLDHTEPPVTAQANACAIDTTFVPAAGPAQPSFCVQDFGGTYRIEGGPEFMQGSGGTLNNAQCFRVLHTRPPLGNTVAFSFVDGCNPAPGITLTLGRPRFYCAAADGSTWVAYRTAKNDAQLVPAPTPTTDALIDVLRQVTAVPCPPGL